MDGNRARADTVRTVTRHDRIFVYALAADQESQPGELWMIARGKVTLARSWRALALAILVLAGIAGVWRVGEHSLTNLGLATLAIGGAGLVAWWSTRRPVAAFGVLLVLATLSRWTIELPIGNMRLEQPAIAFGLLALLYARRLPDRATLRRLRPIVIAFLVYLGALTASSVLYSPDRAESLRMVIWIGLSMAGGLLAFMLLFGGAPESAPRWLRLTAGGQASLGILIAVLYFTLGPIIVAGADPVPGMAGKIFGVSWEANIFASLLAALSFFAIEQFRSRLRPASGALVALVLVGVVVTQTRGAYLGLAAGMITYAGVILYRRHQPRRLILPALVITGAIVFGAWATPVLIPGYRDPNPPINLTTPGWGREFAVGHHLLPALPNLSGPTELAATGVPAPTPTPSPSTGAVPAQTPPPVVVTYPSDTFTFRLDRIPVAIKDWITDPIIGLGSNSFDQRHLDPTQTQAKVPDHIAILAVAALYESGIVGATGLFIGFFLIIRALWRASWQREASGPLAAAYLGSLVSLLVAYQATNALNFSLIWLIAGAGMAIAVRISTGGADETRQVA